MTGLPAQLREILRPLLPERAFLRRARGDATFITNAARWTDAVPDFEASGFRSIEQNGLLLLSPGAAFLTAFERESRPSGFLSRSLVRFRGMPPCEEALNTFAVGIRLLESADDNERNLFDRRVRNLAAVCLRKNLGGAYACALLLERLNRKE